MSENNPRFEEIAPGVFLEALSPDLNINWNPVSNTGVITFNIQKYLLVGNEYKDSLMPVRYGALSLSLEEVIPRTYTPAALTDPVTGVSLANISGAGLTLLIKEVFNVHFGEHHARQASLLTPPE